MGNNREKRSKLIIRPLENMGPAKFFYQQTLGTGESSISISGIKMETQKGAAGIQIFHPKSYRINHYHSEFWRKLIKSIKLLDKK